MKISAVIITFNEERNIERCIQSLRGVVDEIVVVDSYSTDNTEVICKRFGCRFVKHAFGGYIEQKNYALAQAGNEYVLSLDADEALSDSLKKSILKVKQQGEGSAATGYTMNRLTNYCGSWIRHGSWYPDRKLRLFNRKKSCWGGDNPHDKVIMDEGCKAVWLPGDLYHYSFYTVEEHRKQSLKFADISARALYARGRRAGLIQVLFRPLFKIFRDYLFKLGFLDGYYGLLICMITVKATYFKYTKLRTLSRGLVAAR
jgi:glycosyltransferase involved in cell wall biosynthesis